MLIIHNWPLFDIQFQADWLKGMADKRMVHSRRLRNSALKTLAW